MSALPADPAPPGGNDPFVVSLLLALALHVLVILGVGFSSPEERRHPSLPTLDLTVVTHPSRAPVKDADYLAARNQEGAGNRRQRVRAQMPQERRISAAPPPAPAPPEPKVLRQKQARRKVDVAALRPAPRRRRPAPESRHPDATLDLSRLDEQVRRSLELYSRHPRQTFISARTRETRYAEYMNQWRRKVERVGNLNYPDEARRRRLSGKLLLDVAINPDGTVHNITLLRSSGQKVLDDAAIRIVRLAAPFAPFPESIRRDTDILHITRTWEFLNGSGLSTHSR